MFVIFEKHFFHLQMHLQQTTFENIVTNVDIAHKQQYMFLLLPHCVGNSVTNEENARYIYFLRRQFLLVVIFFIMFKNMRRTFVCAVSEKGSKMPNI